MTEPLRFLAPVTPPDTLALANATGVFQALPGLLSWVTLDPLFTGVAAGQRITTVAARAGAAGFTAAAPSTGPVAQAAGKWTGAKFVRGANEVVKSPEVSGTNFGVAIVIYSEGSEATTVQNRDAAGIDTGVSDQAIRRSNGVWSLTGPISASSLAMSPGYQLVIADYTGGMVSVRARDALTTTAVASGAWAGLGATVRLSLGGADGALTNSWGSSIMEAWVFTGPILSNSARLTAIDQYFQRVYL